MPPSARVKAKTANGSRRISIRNRAKGLRGKAQRSVLGCPRSYGRLRDTEDAAVRRRVAERTKRASGPCHRRPVNEYDPPVSIPCHDDDRGTAILGGPRSTTNGRRRAPGEAHRKSRHPRDDGYSGHLTGDVRRLKFHRHGVLGSGWRRSSRRYAPQYRPASARRGDERRLPSQRDRDPSAACCLRCR